MDKFLSSQKFRQFSASLPDSLHNQINKKLEKSFEAQFNPSSLIENHGNFNEKLFPYAEDNYKNLKLPQMYNSEFLYYDNDSFNYKDNWINGVTRYFKPILNYINKNPVKDNKSDWEIPPEEITELYEINSGLEGVVVCGSYKNKLVAVKKVKEKSKTDIKNLKKLQHPNIINFIGVSSTGPYYIVMEHCSKGTLYDALENSSNVTIELVADWCRQIAKGMKFLHENQIVHRDLKSPNILINNENVLKICDFGYSKKLNGISTKMSFSGTIPWMPPEVIKNEKCSEKVDVWSYGVVLWELLTCERPYGELESLTITFNVAHYKLSLPIPSTCPSKFKIILQQCWSIEPKKRPDFSQIVTDLKIANKEFLSNMSNNEFIELKKDWKNEINQNLSKMKNFSEDEILIKQKEELIKHEEIVKDLKTELQNKLKNLDQIINRLEKYEKNLGKDVENKSKRNFYRNHFSFPNMFRNRKSQVKTSKFMHNPIRRSCRASFLVKNQNFKISTKDVETQTNLIDDEKNFTLYKASDSGYGGESTSCLSTPTTKHKLINFNGNQMNYSNKCTKNDLVELRKMNFYKQENKPFNLHEPKKNLNSINENYSELPSGYLETSFENSLKLQTFNSHNDKKKKYLKKANKKKVEEKVESNDSSEEESSPEDDISSDSLNKYSQIFIGSSESLSSSMNSLNCEPESKAIINPEINYLNQDISSIKNIEDSKKFKRNDDSDDSCSLTIANSYVVVPTSKNNLDEQYSNYLVLESPTKDQKPSKNIRDSLLIYKSKGIKKTESLAL